jgi:hypothetical protein
MLNQALSDGHLSGESATGVVYGTTARQTAGTGVIAEWAVRGDDVGQNDFMLVYLNGRLAQRLNGSARTANLLTGSYDTNQVEVLPWRKDMAAPEEWYGAATGQRVHLEWARDTNTSTTSYNVYSSTDDITYNLLASKSEVSLERGYFEMASGATCVIAGDYGGINDHSNTLFTLTITSASACRLQITNDKTADVFLHTYTPGIAFAFLDGVQITIDGTPADSDTCDFLVGVQPYSDSAPLADGTWYFKTSAVDQVGNESSLQETPTIVSIAGPPMPVQAFGDENLLLSYNTATDEITADITQSLSSAADTVNIYSNYCTDTDTLLGRVFYDWPLVSISLAAGATVEDQVILAAAGKPAGVYRFVARATTAAGVEDGAAVERTFTLPYVPPALPTPFGLIVTPIAAGAATLTFYSSALTPLEWTIGGLATDPLAAAPAAEEAFGSYLHTVNLDASDIGPDGTYTLTLAATDGTYSGPSASVTFTTDSTPPSTPSGMVGVAF